jgi:hypothetical protein
MSDKPSLTIAEIADRHRRYMAYAMLAVGTLYFSKAAVHLIPAHIAHYMDYVQVFLAAITVVLIAPIMIWKITHRSASERIVYFSKDGYAAQAFIFAQKRSWAITFVLLTLLEPLTKILANYPVEFAIQLVLAIMLITMSLLFLYKTRPDEDLAFESGEASHA